MTTNYNKKSIGSTKVWNDECVLLHNGQQYGMKPPVQRKRRAAAKCVYLNVNNVDDHQYMSMLNDAVITQKGLHEKLSAKSDATRHHLSKVQAKFLNVDNNKRNQSNHPYSARNGKDQMSRNSRTSEEENIAEAVLLLHQTKHGLYPNHTNHLDVPHDKVRSNRNAYHSPENPTTTNQLRMNTKTKNGHWYRQEQYQSKNSSDPILPINGQRKEQFASNYETHDLSALYGIAQHKHPQRSFTTTTKTLPAIINAASSLNINTNYKGGKLNHVTGTAAPLGTDLNHDTSMVLHDIISSYPIRHDGTLLSTSQPSLSMRPPESTDSSVHSKSNKRGLYIPPPPPHKRFGDVNEQQQQPRPEQRRKMNHQYHTTQSAAAIAQEQQRRILNHHYETATATALDIGRSTSSNYRETDIGRLQQVNETWKKRYLELLRDVEQEGMNRGQL
jgi:hypothetical protein